MSDEAAYWRELWEKTANGLLGAHADIELLTAERDKLLRKLDDVLSRNEDGDQILWKTMQERDRLRAKVAEQEQELVNFSEWVGRLRAAGERAP